MKSIRWIQNVLIDGNPGCLEIMMGVQSIADRCYVRVNQEPEFWFTAQSGHRGDILLQGLDLLRQQLAQHQVTLPNGSPFSWTSL